MGVEFLSIVIFTFAFALAALGVITWWLDRGKRQTVGGLMIVAGVFIAAFYAFLGSRWSIAVFGRLIIRIDLPLLMTRAILYTIAVVLGFGVAGGVFLWNSGRLVRPTRQERQIVAFVVLILLVALLISLAAVALSH